MGTISWMRGAGPLVPFAEGFEEELSRLGQIRTIPVDQAVGGDLFLVARAR